MPADEPAQPRSATKGTRSKRQRAHKPWIHSNLNDENSPSLANVTPATVQPTTGKRARFAQSLDEDAGKSTVKQEPSRKSSIKKEPYSKSTIKKELPKFAMVSSLQM